MKSNSTSPCSGGNGDIGSNGDFDIDSDGTVGGDTDCDLKFGILVNVRMVLVGHCSGDVGGPLVLW